MKNMKIRDTKKRTDNRRIREGDYAKPGVTIQGEWTTFTFDAEKEDSCFVVLKDIQTQKEEKIVVPAEYCMGSVRSVAVADLHLEHLIYDFEINGKKNHRGRSCGRDSAAGSSMRCMGHLMCRSLTGGRMYVRKYRENR